MSNQWTDSSMPDEGLQAEQAVLGSILMDSSVMDEIGTMLNEQDFTAHIHSLIWRCVKYMYDQKVPIDPITIKDTLQRYGKLEEIGGIAYVLQLGQSVPSSASAKHYAGIVKRKSLKRKGMQLSEDIRRMTEEDDFETDEQYFQLIDTMAMQMRPQQTARMRGFDETEQEYSDFLDTKADLIKTGFIQFDDWSGGVGRGWLIIKAGRPSIGKTANALQMAVAIARQNVGDILFWSQEMTFSQLKNRLVSPVTGINFSRIRKKELESWEKERIMDAHREIGRFPLFVEDSAGVSIDHIRATARQIKRKRGQIGAIFVDYLTRMDIKQEKNQTWSRAVGEVAKRFKWLAQEMECPVILLAQLNREGAEGAPQLHHLRDSGEIEQEADVIEFLWTNPEDTSKDGVVVQSTIAKGRDIGTSNFRYLFKGWVQKYEDYKEVSYAPNLQSGTPFRKTSGGRNRPA
jgi:replicative DNA helicase